MQVINETTPGERIGSAVGQGLSALLQHKLQHMQGQTAKTKTFQALKALGAPDEEAAAMANMPESLQAKMFPNYVNSLMEQRRSNPPQAQQAEQQPQQPQNSLAALQGLSAAAPSQEAAIGQPQAGIAPAPDFDNTNNTIIINNNNNLTSRFRLKNSI